MFRAYLVYCLRVMSVGCVRTEVAAFGFNEVPGIFYTI
jgi:hypothetical protein